MWDFRLLLVKSQSKSLVCHSREGGNPGIIKHSVFLDSGYPPSANSGMTKAVVWVKSKM
jgi:hypothetical protein